MPWCCFRLNSFKCSIVKHLIRVQMVAWFFSELFFFFFFIFYLIFSLLLSLCSWKKVSHNEQLSNTCRPVPCRVVHWPSAKILAEGKLVDQGLLTFKSRWLFQKTSSSVTSYRENITSCSVLQFQQTKKLSDFKKDYVIYGISYLTKFCLQSSKLIFC